MNYARIPGFGDAETWGYANKANPNSPFYEEPEECGCKHELTEKEIDSGVCDVCGLPVLVNED